MLLWNTNDLFYTKRKLHQARTSFMLPEMTVIATEIRRPKNYPPFFNRSSRLL